MSALCTRSLYSSGDIPATYFCWRLRLPQGHSVAKRGRLRLPQGQNVAKKGRLRLPQGHSVAKRIKSMTNTWKAKLFGSVLVSVLSASINISLWCTDHSSVCLLPHRSISALHNTTYFPHYLAFTNHGFSYIVAG